MMTGTKDIERTVRCLPEAAGLRQLFDGVESDLAFVPRNVVQFSRTSERYLRPGELSYHHRYVLVVCLRQPGCVMVDGCVNQLAPRQGLLVFPYQCHTFTPFTDTADMLWAFTTFEYPDERELEALRGVVFKLNDASLDTLRRIGNAYLTYLDDHARGGTEMPFLLGGLLIQLMRMAEIVPRPQRPAGGRPEQHASPFLGRVMEYINKNMDQSVGIREIAQALNLSPSRVREVFKQEIGVSLGSFVRNTRIYRACGMMHDSNLSIAELAHLCGFSSACTFSRTFRSVVGATPREFRGKMHRSRFQTPRGGASPYGISPETRGRSPDHRASKRSVQDGYTPNDPVKPRSIE